MKKSLFIFLTGLLLLALFVGSASAMGGSGTQADPWTINSLADLKLLSGTGYASYVGSDKYFLLTTDIQDDGSFASIGQYSYTFNGNFDGGNHTIYHLRGSLFYCLAGNLQNINFETAYMLKKSIISWNGLPANQSSSIVNCNLNNIYCGDGGVTSMGFFYSSIYNSSTLLIKNCVINHCTLAMDISDGKGGAFVGSISNGTIQMENCQVLNSSLINYSVSSSTKYKRYMSGFIYNDGVPQSSIVCKNCIINNTNINAKHGTYSFSNNFTNIDNTALNLRWEENVYLRFLGDTSLTNDSPQTDQKATGEIVTFTVDGQQGAAINMARIGYDYVFQGSGYSFNYGEGGIQVAFNPLTSQYTTNGIKNVTLTLIGWNNQNGNSFTLNALTSTAYIKLPLQMTDFTTNPSSSSYSPTNVSVSLTALTSGGTPTSYVWSYTTDSNPSASSSWTNIGTTSTNTTTFTPTSTGTYTFRVVASMTGASVDSLDVPLKPYLQIFVSLNGDGTSSNPYQVGSDADLQHWNTYNTYYNDKYMSITQDFVPTVTVNKFEGHLEGNNHVLSQGQKSLFYTLNATVQNLTLSKFINKGYYGILSEYGSASVSNVTVEESYVQRSNIVGGIIGRANGSTFTNCTVNHVTIKATASTGVAGGITGEGNVTVTNCRVLNSDILATTSYGVCP